MTHTLAGRSRNDSVSRPRDLAPATSWTPEKASWRQVCTEALGRKRVDESHDLRKRYTLYRK